MAERHSRANRIAMVEYHISMGIFEFSLNEKLFDFIDFLYGLIIRYAEH